MIWLKWITLMFWVFEHYLLIINVKVGCSIFDKVSRPELLFSPLSFRSIYYLSRVKRKVKDIVFVFIKSANSSKRLFRMRTLWPWRQPCFSAGLTKTWPTSTTTWTTSLRTTSMSTSTWRSTNAPKLFCSSFFCC